MTRGRLNNQICLRPRHQRVTVKLGHANVMGKMEVRSVGEVIGGMGDLAPDDARDRRTWI
ncbi:hypothetical protein HFO91_03735 [Rhizobium leguminosarum]|uniref:hypothetical protein n=1 Tax=Rhizobium leguminosarum TaxID=384 RepID=UPI001C96168F|nr:hypothetical protein [Rhizobium leguminosarum]MBY5448782.1 hypothetical protein [Rhizobium leguminosarum]